MIQPQSTRPRSASGLLLEAIERAHSSQQNLREGIKRWHKRRRESQTPPDGDWFLWLLLAGRGFGKTFTGGGWINEEAWNAEPGEQLLIAGRTPSDVRDYSLYGQGGLLKHYPEIKYEPSKRMLVWPNGAVGLIRSGANPEEFRGFSGKKAWLDEFAAWDYPRDCWDNLRFGVREQGNPQICMTTTPKPISVLKEIIEARSTVVVRGSSYENRANLSEKWVREVLDPLRSTRLGRQEIEAELLEDVEGALWSRGLIEDTRVKSAPDLVRACVGLDPSVTAKRTSDEAGIVAAGMGADGHGYALADASGRLPPPEWARRSAGLVRDMGLDCIVAEVNQGGDMVAETIRVVDSGVVVRMVRAMRGKYLRAEPVATLWEQGRCHIVGNLPELEDEMCSWTPLSRESPNRLDAMVWAMTHLMLGQEPMIGRAQPRSA